MEEQKVIDIKVQADSSKVEQAFKDIEKSSEQMTNRVDNSNKRVNQSFKGIEGQVKNTATQMQKAFQKVNMSGLIKSMNKIKQTVSQSMQQVKNQIKMPDLTSEIGSIRHLQVKLETSKAKEDAIALGNALASLEERAKKVGVSLSSLNRIQKLNNTLAESNTKLTNAQRQAMVNYSHLAISELHQVQSEQGKLGKSINSILHLYKRGAPQISSVTDKIKKKIVQWKNSHVSTTKSIKNANKTLTSSFKSVLSAITPFVSLYAIFAGLKNAINDAMESIETDNMFNTVMGSASKEMDAWVKELNHTVRLGITNTKQYTATITQMGRAMGLTGQQAIDMSKQMAVMAGDISSFYNTDLASVQADLRSALSGSFETMDKYGVILRANTIKEYAYANGIANTGAELTNAQRAIATTMMIEEQLGLANGDLARSLKSPSNQTRVLKSNLSDLSVALGKCFTPILTVVLPILNTFVQALTATINAIANFISQVFALFGVEVDFGVGGVVDDITGGLEDANISSGGVSDNLANGADSAKEIKKSLSGIDEINILSDNSSSSNSSGGSGSTGGISGGNIDTGAIDSGLAQTETKFSQWAQKVAGALQTVWDSLSSGWNSVSDYINGSLDNLKQAFSNLGSSIESFLVGCWNNGGEELIYNIGRLAGVFTGLAFDVGSQVIDAVSKLFDHMNPDNNVNTRKFIEAMNNALVACQNFALSAGGWLEKFMNSGGQAFINNVGDIAVIVGTILTKAFDDGVRAITDFFNSYIGQAIIESFAMLLEDLSGILEVMLGWVRDNQELLEALGLAVLGAYGSFKLINGAIKLFNGVMIICSGIMTILSTAGTILGGVIAFLTSPIGLAVLAIGVLIGIGVLLWQNWDTIKVKCVELWQGLQTYWEYIKTAVVAKCTDIKDKTIAIWSSIKQTVTDKVIEIKDSIVTKFTEAKESAIEKATEINDNIYQKFTDAYTNVASIFGKIKTEISEKIGEARDAVKKAIDKIREFLNFEWSLPKLKLPKISISGKFSLNPISVPSFGISWHRKGGILPAGSNAIFGMNGNNLMAGGEISTGGEAILPLSDLFKEMRSMFSDQNQQLISNLSSSNDQPIEIVVQVKDTQLARIVIDSINKLQRQSGRTLLEVGS